MTQLLNGKSWEIHSAFIRALACRFSLFPIFRLLWSCFGVLVGAFMRIAVLHSAAARDLMYSLYADRFQASVRRDYPIFDDKESVDSVLAGSAPGTWEAQDYNNSTAYSIVMNMSW